MVDPLKQRTKLGRNPNKHKKEDILRTFQVRTSFIEASNAGTPWMKTRGQDHTCLSGIQLL